MMDENTRGKENGINKMLNAGKTARQGAIKAASEMWSNTKIIRMKFPNASRGGNGNTVPRRASYNMFTLKPGNSNKSMPTDDLSIPEEPELIYNSMKDMWEADVFSLPVCKDLPRLIRRICVLDQDEEILYLAPGSTAPEYTPLLRSKKESERKKSEDGGEGEELDESASKSEQSDDLEAASAPEPVSEPPVKRSSRLMRWSIRKKKNGISKDSENSNSNTTLARLIVDFILVLAKKMDMDDDAYESLEKELREIEGSVTESSDLQLVMKQVIETIGPDSMLTKILKTIHQNVVLQSTVELKQKLTMKYQTKDVRTSDGWRIVIQICKGFIQVRHTRREQSLDAFGDTKNHWEFEWELRMTFDQKMEGMTAAQLRITHLMLSDTMDEELAEELKNTLVDGLIVM